MSELSERFRKLARYAAALEPNARLAVMAQNPANHYHWTKQIGSITAAELVIMADVAAAAAEALAPPGDE